MANTVLAKMAVQIAANTAEFNKALQKTSNDIGKFTNDIKSIGGAIGIAFGVQQVASFSLEIAKLAGEADGVRAAFNKFPDSKKLLDELKRATGDTVSELELMKRTVQATNFGISLSSLPKLLEFAAVRAQQTGQSVDYLVDSIVTGIGRKSPLILDNLGISAVALKEKLNGVSIAEAEVGQVADAVGKIAEEGLSKMGKLADTTATKIQKLSSDWTNLKVAIGDLLNQAGAGSFLNDISNSLGAITALLKGELVPTIDKLYLAIYQFNKNQPKGAEFYDQYNKIGELAKKAGIQLVYLEDSATGVRKIIVDPRTKMAVAEVTDTFDKQIITVDILQEKLKELNTEFEKIDVSDKNKLKNIGDQIIAIDAQIKKLEELRKAQEKTDPVNTLIRQSNARTPQEFAKDNPITNAVGTLSSGDFLNGAQQRMLDFIKTIKTLPVEFRSVEKEMVDISGLISGGIVDIANAFGQAVTSGADFGKAIIQSLANFAQQFGGLLIAAGIGKIAFDKFSGPQMIIAGAALVAIGGAIRSTVSNRPNLGGSSSGNGQTFTRPSVSGSSFSDIKLTGKLVGEGSSLIAVISNAQADNGRRRG